MITVSQWYNNHQVNQMPSHHDVLVNVVSYSRLLRYISPLRLRVVYMNSVLERLVLQSIRNSVRFGYTNHDLDSQ